MRKYIVLISALIAFKFAIHAIGNLNYGYQRDELLHLSVGQHVDWGYMEFPPFIGLLGSFAHHVFNDNLWLTRLLSTGAGLAILIITCLAVVEMGGKRPAVFLGGMCVVGFLPFYRNHTLFQPVAFEQLFWTAGFFVLILYINSGNARLLIALCTIAALAILDKYTSLVWTFSVVVALLCHNRAQPFRNRELYLGALVAAALVIPNVIWQWQHDFPLLKHLEALKASQLEKIDPLEFGLDQLKSPFTFIVSLLAVGGLLFNREISRYRPVGIAVMLLFILLWIQGAKSYYFFGAYPILFAAGAVVIERWCTRKPLIVYVAGFVIFLFACPFIPRLTPVLPIERFVSYIGEPEVNGRVELTSDYADMFGWEEQVILIDSVYRKLDEDERKHTTIFSSNYGEAGAVKIIGAKYGLPDPICVSGSFWLWGYGNPSATTFLCLGFEEETIDNFFNEKHLVKVIRHRYAVEEENNITLYLCRQPKFAIAEKWPEFEKYIFN